MQPPVFPDTAPLVRIDLATRKVDTIGYLKIEKINMSVTQDANGRMSMSSITNPMPVTDDWAVLTDGSVALLRGQDYHVDWIRADGQLQSTPKVPFAWRHMTDSSKAAFIDSAKTAMEKLREQFNAQRAAGGNAPNIMGPPDGGGAGEMISRQRAAPVARAEHSTGAKTRPEHRSRLLFCFFLVFLCSSRCARKRSRLS